MRLTLCLLGKFNRKLNRRLFSGKHRLTRLLTMTDRRLLLRDLVWEEENLFYLRQPYLTPEEDKRHAIACGRHREKIDMYNALRFEKTKLKDVTFEERLEHAKFEDKWE